MYDVMIKPNFTLRLKQTNKQEQHANGPLSAGMAGAVYMCVCVCQRQWGWRVCCVKETKRVWVCRRGVTVTMAGIVYQSPSSINQDDPALIGVLVKLVSRPPFPPLA